MDMNDKNLVDSFIYLIVPPWYTSAAHQASLVKPWLVFWRDAVEPNSHGETKRAWYAAKAYQKDTIGYLPYPDSAQNLALR